MMIWVQSFLLLLFVPFGSSPLPGQDFDVSLSPEDDVVLRIERSRDLDEVWYAVNTDANGNPIEHAPIKVFWIRKSNNNEIEPLTNIQESIGYGIRNLEQVSDEKWNFKLAGYKEHTFILERSDLKDFHLAVNYEGKKIRVEKLYISFKERSFLLPVVSYVKMFGEEIKNGKKFSAIISD